MCIAADMNTAAAERMRKHAEAFKAEHRDSLITQPGLTMVNTDDHRSDAHDSNVIRPDCWLTDQELAKLASSGAIEGRRRTPPVRGWARRALGVAYLAAFALALWAFAWVGPKVPAFLNWITQ